MALKLTETNRTRALQRRCVERTAFGLDPGTLAANAAGDKHSDQQAIARRG